MVVGSIPTVGEIKKLMTSLAGLEPAIFHLGGGRVIHCATETTRKYQFFHFALLDAATRDRTGDLQIFSLTLSQLSYSGYAGWMRMRMMGPRRG